MRPSDGRFDIWPLAVIGFIVVLVLASINPVMRLNTEAPSDFTDLAIHAGKPDRALARQYWETSVKIIQLKYRRTDSLPPTPPDEFRPAANPDRARAQSAAVRQTYWNSLRDEWQKADNWHTSYTVDVSWVWNNLQSIWNGVSDFFRNHG